METANLPRRPSLLLDKAELFAWLNIKDAWWRERDRTDPNFPKVDFAKANAARRDLRFDALSVAQHLGMTLHLDAEGRPVQLLTVEQLRPWLKVGATWVDERVATGELPFIDLSRPGAEKRTLRFDPIDVAERYGLPLHDMAATAA